MDRDPDQRDEGSTRSSGPQPGGRGTARPGGRTAGDQGSLELTVGVPQGAAEPPAPGRLHPTDRAALAEELHGAATQAVKDSVQTALAPVLTRLSAVREEIREEAGEILKHVQGVAAIMDETADGWQETGDEVQNQIRALSQEAREEEQEKRERLDRAIQMMEDGTADLRRAARLIGWRPWLMAMGSAVVLLLAVTLLRPGWTMSADQRAALRVGETVIRAYDSAEPARQEEIRRVLRWRSTPPPKSAETAPPPARRR